MGGRVENVLHPGGGDCFTFDMTLLRVFIIRDNISIVIYVVSHHFIRFDSLDDRLNVMFLFKYLRRMVQVIRYESFDIKGCLF